MLSTRRSFLRGLLAAPAVVSASSLMPVKLFDPTPIGAWTRYSGYEPVHLTLNDIVTSTLRNHAAEVIANIEANNALLRYLKAKDAPGIQWSSS
jgi:hypothetical protein